VISRYLFPLIFIASIYLFIWSMKIPVTNSQTKQHRIGRTDGNMRLVQYRVKWLLNILVSTP
jgi:hypothetical protein